MKLNILFKKSCFLFLFFFLGCTIQSKQPSHTLRITIIKDPPTLDPRQGGGVIESLLHFILFDGLTRPQPDGSISLNLAKNVTISEDQKKYIFELRSAKWSNGSFITAKDFELSWKKILTPNFPAPNVQLLYPIKNARHAKNGKCSLDSVGITAINETTLVVELEKPTPYFLTLLSFCTFFPINPAVDQKNPDWMNKAGEDFVCNGAFTLVEWKRGNEIVLKKNPQYWNASQIHLDTIHISTIPNQNTALHLYEKGDIDLIGFGYSPIPKEAISQLKGALISYPTPKTSVVYFNVTKFPFNNKNIRKAFGYSINREEIVHDITQLEEEIATNLIPPVLNKGKKNSFFKDNDITSALYHFQLGLQELGITKEQFPIITYYYSSADLSHQIAQNLQQTWKKLFNISISLKKNDFPLFADALAHKNYDIAQTFYSAQYNDPISILDRFTNKQNSKNFPGWENQNYTQLVELGAFEENATLRAELFEAAENILLEEMAIAPIYHAKTCFMMKPYLTHPPIAKDGIFEITKICFKKS